jgi:hypothetical protein
LTTVADNFGPSWKNNTRSRSRMRAHEWQSEDPKAQKTSRSAKLLGVAVGAIAVMALIIWLIMRLIPERQAQFFVIALDYNTNPAIPANLFADELGTDFNKWAQAQREANQSTWASTRNEILDAKTLRSNKTPLPNDDDAQDVEDWGTELEKNIAHTLVFYISAHGLCDQKGPYLLTDIHQKDGKVTVQKTYLRSILDRMSRGKLATKKILLLLDTMQVNLNWELGAIGNDFAKGIKELYKDRNNQTIADNPNLIVLCSANEGQQSWVSDDLQQSVFAHWTLQGLRGEATEGSAGNASTRVLGSTLCNFIRNRTADWVQANRSEVQTPFLLPEGADTEARLADFKLINVLNTTTKDSAGKRSTAALGEVKKLWQVCAALDSEVPKPCVHSPYHWRRLREVLVRAERLARAGNEEAANKWIAEARNLTEILKNTWRTKIKSALENSLVIRRAIYDKSVEITPGWEKNLDDLWLANENPEDFKKKWLTYTMGQAPPMQPIYRHLYEKIVTLCRDVKKDDVAAKFNTVRDTLTLYESKNAPIRPVEVHFMMLLTQFYRDKTKTNPPPGDVMELALVVRRLAEDAALMAPRTVVRGVRPAFYSDHLPASVRAAIQAADAERRQAEDLLFSADNKAHDNARTILEKVRAEYERVLTDYQTVQKAFHQRDLALADLPYYSHWVAQGDFKTAEFTKLSELWTLVHQLTGLLEEYDESDVRVKLSDLEKLTTDIAKGMKDYFDLVQVEYSRLTNNASEIGSEFVRLERLLQLPILLPNQRDTLLDQGRRVSGKLNDAYLDKPDRVRGTNKPEDTPLTVIDLDRHKRQFEVGLRVIGDKWLEKQVKGTDVSTPDAKRLRDDVAQGNEQARRAAFHQVGWHWRSLTEWTDNVRAKLDDRERFATLAHCYTSIERKTATALSEPTWQATNNRWQRLLVWHGKRATLDRYFDGTETTEAKSYSRDRAINYLTDAEGLAAVDKTPGRPPRKWVDDATQEEALLVRALAEYKGLSALSSKGDKVGLTDEMLYEILFTVKNTTLDPDKAPAAMLNKLKFMDGYAVTNLRIPQNKPPMSLTAASAAQRREFKISAQEETVKAELNVLGGLDRFRETSSFDVELQTYHRGQYIKTKTTVTQQVRPSLIVSHREPPPGGNVALRAGSQLDEGELMLVLDATNSMGATDESSSKYRQAVEMLRAMLRDMPKGTPYAVRVFGLNYDDAKFRELKDSIGEDKALAEATLDEEIIRGEADWEAGDTAKIEAIIQDKFIRRRPQLKDKEGKLFKDANGRPIWGWNSPIVRSLCNAASDLATRGDEKRPRKTLIFLTDGQDNTSAKVDKFLKDKFPKNKDIAVHMIIFRPEDPKDAAIAKQQFSAALKELNPPGTIDEAVNEEQLKNLIMDALRPKLTLATVQGDRRLEPKEGLRPRLPTELPGWWPTKIETTREYEARVGNQYQQRIELRHSDRLLMELVKTDVGIQFARRTASAELQRTNRSILEQAGRFNTDKRWELLLHHNESAGSTLNVRATTEDVTRLRPGKDRALRVDRPEFAWLELASPQIISTKQTITISNLVDDTNVPKWTAPAWQIAVEPWASGLPVSEAGLKLSAWASTSFPSVLHEERRASNDQSRLVKKYQYDGKSFDLSINVEEQAVRVKYTDTDLTPRAKCLVVRLEHPAGKPVIANIKRDAGTTSLFTGHEHRLYQEANKYTGVFWPYSPGTEFTVELIALEQFKASDNTSKLKLENMPEVR